MTAFSELSNTDATYYFRITKLQPAKYKKPSESLLDFGGFLYLAFIRLLQEFVWAVSVADTAEEFENQVGNFRGVADVAAVVFSGEDAADGSGNVVCNKTGV